MTTLDDRDGTCERRAPGPISTRGLGALRVAATLTHALPGLRIRVLSAADLLVEVRADRPTHGSHTRPRVVLSPCQFHCAIARAHREAPARLDLSPLRVPLGVEPRVEIGIPARGQARPGGLYRLPLGDRWIWAFATTLPARVAFDLGRPLVGAARATLDVAALGIRSDPATEVSLAYAETTADVGSVTEDALVDLLESLMALWSAHELLSSLVEPQDPTPG